MLWLWESVRHDFKVPAWSTLWSTLRKKHYRSNSHNSQRMGNRKGGNSKLEKNHPVRRPHPTTHLDDSDVGGTRSERRHMAGMSACSALQPELSQNGTIQPRMQGPELHRCNNSLVWPLPVLFSAWLSTRLPSYTDQSLRKSLLTPAQDIRLVPAPSCFKVGLVVSQARHSLRNENKYLELNGWYIWNWAKLMDLELK